jgi:uncharacterized membrane protein YkoI
MTAERRRCVSLLMLAAFALGAPVVRAGQPRDLDKIPKRVMDALNVKFPNAAIEKWTKESENGKNIYDLEFRLAGRKAEADIAEDGAIQNFERELDVTALPPAVVQAVEKRYPKSKMREVMAITEIKNGREIDGGFEIVLETADRKEVEVTVAKNGKILEDSGAKKPED